MTKVHWEKAKQQIDTWDGWSCEVQSGIIHLRLVTEPSVMLIWQFSRRHSLQKTWRHGSNKRHFEPGWAVKQTAHECVDNANS